MSEKPTFWGGVKKICQDAAYNFELSTFLARAFWWFMILFPIGFYLLLVWLGNNGKCLDC